MQTISADSNKLEQNNLFDTEHIEVDLKGRSVRRRLICLLLIENLLFQILFL